ncbi:FecR domain-containing protein [Pseudorhodoferax sp.]|uniref:FecR domain-containing protein n=1 Tax=Pseudorhodoferax sp. TaxID=1993553 RepID=UPI002DD646E9|nr:FecR domain-containing protein [Pseudorhodoferax sp.]
MNAPALDQAIAWAVRLASGTASEAERGACAAWRQARPEHEQAWQQVQAVEAQFALPASQARLAHGALQAAGARRGRRQALQLLGLGAVGVLGALAWRWAPPMEQRLLATAAGERHRTAMADGGTLHLAPDTQAELAFSLLRRTVRLDRGEVFVDTGADPQARLARRPFWVEAAGARFEALGTRFGVRQDAQATLLYVREGRVAIHAPGLATPLVVRAGESYQLLPGQPQPRRTPDDGAVAGAWTEGVIVARRMRLDVFAAELARQRATALDCAPEVAALRVSGVFQLDGPDPVGRALDVLARTLPVRVRAVDGGQRLVPG